MLTATNLTYGPPHSAPLAQHISFSVAPGEVLQLVGENGVGKSFLLKTILGLCAPLSGKIENNFSSIRYLPQMQNRAAHLPYSLGELLRGGDGAGLVNPARHALGWNQASGGERQRTLLARFFTQEGNLLVLDEPFNHLDGPARELVRAKLRATLENKAIGAIIVSHGDQVQNWLAHSEVKTLRLGESSA